jgi:hypothetical protein
MKKSRSLTIRLEDDLEQELQAAWAETVAPAGDGRGHGDTW